MSFLSKKFLFCILALNIVTAALSGASSSNETWQRFTAEKNGFSIDLPQKPEHIHQQITIPKSDLSIDYDTFISEPSDKIVYVISVWEYPDIIDMSKPEVNLKDGFGGMLSALPDSEVLEMNMTEVQGNKALEFLVKNEDIFFHGKLVLVKNTLYQIFSVYKEGEHAEESYKHFIDSFRLTNEPSVKDEESAKNHKMNV